MQSPTCVQCYFHTFSIPCSYFLMSPMSFTRPAVTLVRMSGSTETSLIKKPTFVSFVPRIHNGSPYFFYLTCEFSLQYAWYVLVHALLLVSRFGYRLFLLCHPDCLLTMALVSMALHVSCMRSLCKKQSRTGGQMMLSVVGYGVAEQFVQSFAGLRVNKQSRVTLNPIRKAMARKQLPRWLTNFSKKASYVWFGMRCMVLP